MMINQEKMRFLVCLIFKYQPNIFSYENCQNHLKYKMLLIFSDSQSCIRQFQFLFFIPPNLSLFTLYIYSPMNHQQSFQLDPHSIQRYQPKISRCRVPLKFKAIILNSIYDKHRGKQLSCKRKAFFTWYVQKNDNQLIKDHIDMVLIGQNEAKFSASRFFYRMKYFIRKELSIINYQPDLQTQRRENQEKKKQKSSNSEIKQKQRCQKKNFVDYFQSLKHIFSVKLIQCEQKLLSVSVINDEKNEPKHQRLKTEGCKVESFGDKSFQAQCRQSINRQQKMVELQKKQMELDKKYWDMESKQSEICKKLEEKAKHVKELGKKVAFMLIKSFIGTKQRQILQHLISQLSKHSQYSKLTEQQQMTKLHHLQLLNKQSSQIQIQTQINQFCPTSQSLLQTQKSSQFSLPSLNHIDNQISHVNYSIGLLSLTINRNNDLHELYQQFQSQFCSFQAIQKDFQLLKLKTRNSLFDRLLNLNQKLQSSLLKQAFSLLKQSTIRKPSKANTLNLSRSRFNLNTLHQLFSRPLIPQSTQLNQKQDNQFQVKCSMTSIKMICERNPNTDSILLKPQSRGVIKKQTFNLVQSNTKNELNFEISSSFGQNFLKEKPAFLRKNPSSNQPSKTHVNFLLPQSPVSSKNQIKPKKSQVTLVYNNEDLRKKQENKMNNTGFYDLSMKSFSSDASSSASKKYHAQLKSQYCWNDIEQKESQAFYDGKEINRISQSSIGNDEGF